jgi:hypothetical protein
MEQVLDAEEIIDLTADSDMEEEFEAEIEVQIIF